MDMNGMRSPSRCRGVGELASTHWDYEPGWQWCCVLVLVLGNRTTSPTTANRCCYRFKQWGDHVSAENSFLDLFVIALFTTAPRGVEGTYSVVQMCVCVCARTAALHSEWGYDVLYRPNVFRGGDAYEEYKLTVYWISCHVDIPRKRKS